MHDSTLVRRLQSRGDMDAETQCLHGWQRATRDTMHPVNREEFDRLVAKATTSGVGSLTPDEQAFLDRMSPPQA